ncbi:MAG: rhodanese-like domain-containing protein [Cloacibacterium sp.]|nr:rhodanese-like domain-containing protein [Cloacibacterium sp.]
MKNTSHLVVILFLVFVFPQCSSPQRAKTNQTTKKETSIKKQIENGAFLVDVRTPEEYAEGSVKGAVNIPLDQIPNRLEEFEGKTSVIVFCRSGNRSGQAKSILEAKGIQNVTNGINTENLNQELGK